MTGEKDGALEIGATGTARGGLAPSADLSGFHAHMPVAPRTGGVPAVSIEGWARLTGVRPANGTVLPRY